MTADFDSIPVIDITGLSAPDLTARRAVAEQMSAAAREVGFLYVSGHGLDERLFEHVLAAARAFLAQPMAAQMASYIGGPANPSAHVPEAATCRTACRERV